LLPFMRNLLAKLHREIGNASDRGPNGLFSTWTSVILVLWRKPLGFVRR
jgi:hypothetical protein